MGAIRRDGTALVAAWAFALATTVIPSLHLAFHSRPHSHSATGVRYHAAVERSPHTHGHGHPHDHLNLPRAAPAGSDHPHRHRPAPGSELPAEQQPDHGLGSAAHFLLALNDAPASALTPLDGCLREVGQLALAGRVGIHSRQSGTLRLRGPPFLA